MSISSEINRIRFEVGTQEDLLRRIRSALNGKAAGGEYLPFLQDMLITENGTYTADEGYDGLGTVTVDVDIPDLELQTKTIAPTKETQTVTPDSGYDGLSEVTVDPIPNQYIVPSGTKTITENGAHDVTQYSIALVDVPETELQEKIATISENGRTIVTPDSGKALSKVSIYVNVPETIPETKPIATSLIRQGIGYIDTGIDAANSNLTIQIRYELETVPTGYWYLIRAYVDESTNSTRILYNKTTATYCCVNSIPSSSLSLSLTRHAGVVYTDILKPESGTTFSYTSNKTKATKTRTSGTSLVGKNIWLFSSTDDGVVAKVYYLKIYDGETLVRDFIPFVTQDGECGLYDNVTKQFYGNSGSGTFEAETRTY